MAAGFSFTFSAFGLEPEFRSACLKSGRAQRRFMMKKLGLTALAALTIVASVAVAATDATIVRAASAVRPNFFIMNLLWARPDFKHADRNSGSSPNALKVNENPAAIRRNESAAWAGCYE